MMNKIKIKEIYKEKFKKFIKFNQSYFEKDRPIVSDSEFDKLKNELLELAKKYPFLKKINDLDKIVG